MGYFDINSSECSAHHLNPEGAWPSFWIFWYVLQFLYILDPELISPLVSLPSMTNEFAARCWYFLSKSKIRLSTSAKRSAVERTRLVLLKGWNREECGAVPESLQITGKRWKNMIFLAICKPPGICFSQKDLQPETHRFQVEEFSRDSVPETSETHSWRFWRIFRVLEKDVEKGDKVTKCLVFRFQRTSTKVWIAGLAIENSAWYKLAAWTLYLPVHTSNLRLEIDDFGCW